jgi:hypothetical protein
MTRHRCERCGATNAPDAQFCAACDGYLGWDAGATTLDDAPLTTAIPAPREPREQTEKLATSAPGLDRPGAARPAARPPAIALPNTSPVVAPEFNVLPTEVSIDPVTGGSFDIVVRNRSSVSDGYTVTALDTPPWLSLEHPRLRVGAGGRETFAIRLVIAPSRTHMVHVQRIRARLQVCSVEQPAKRSEVEFVVVVARFGPPATMTAEPATIRLHDRSGGDFRLRLDNRASNYPQRFELSGTDRDGLVRFTFRPRVVEVPPTGVESVDVHFDVASPRPGIRVSRTLVVTAANNATRLQTRVDVEHHTTPSPPDVPVELRLEPAATRLRDQTAAEVMLAVDNRRGSKDRRLHFAGREPTGQLRFDFDQPQVYVRAGELAQVRVTISATLPRPGEQIERTFSLTCSDGTAESRTTGTFGVLSSSTSDSMTQLRPAPLPVASFSGAATPIADARTEVASAAQAAPAESRHRSRRVLRKALTALGAALIVVGAIRPWFSGGPTYAVNGILQLPKILALTPLDDTERHSKLEQLTQPGGRVVVLILAVLLLLGMLSAAGRYTAIAGLVAAVSMAGYVGYAMTALSASGPAYGAILVVLGGLIGALGGLCARYAART